MNTHFLSNLHTHTNYCDGKDCAEAILLEAIDQGIETIGFSGHSYVSFDLECCMTPQETEAYKQEICALRDRYKDRIAVLLGIEQDFFSDMPVTNDFDYVIGSTHYLPDANGFFAIDHTREILTDAVNRCFGGDIYRLIETYYGYQSRVAEQTKCEIVGHFDLITKFNECGVLFDEDDPRYITPAFDALDALLQKDVFFEINTGAISRGYRTLPYPSKSILTRILQKGGRLVLSSDAHAKENLLFGFSDALAYLKAAGGNSLWWRTREGWIEKSI